MEIVVLVVGVIILVVGLNSIKHQDNKARQLVEEKRKEDQVQHLNYDSFVKVNQIPIHMPRHVCLDYEKLNEKSRMFFIWEDDNQSHINLFCCDNEKNEYTVHTIIISDILYFKEYLTQNSEYKQITKTGGYSTKGAIVGGAVAGIPGAMIGSKKESEIIIEGKNQNTKICEMGYRCGENTEVLKFGEGTFAYFYSIFPDKCID